jgi:hypothetical protein
MERKKANLFNGGGSTSTALAARTKGKKKSNFKDKGLRTKTHPKMNSESGCG